MNTDSTLSDIASDVWYHSMEVSAALTGRAVTGRNAAMRRVGVFTPAESEAVTASARATEVALAIAKRHRLAGA